MKKNFIITESERDQIRKMYGLLRESPDDEIKAYLDYYLANRTCKQIAEDFETYKKAEDYKKLSKEEQDMIDKAIMGLKNPKVATSSMFGVNPNPVPCEKGKDECQCVKDFMKSKLLGQLSVNRDQVIAQVCVIQSIYPPQTPLTFCGNSGDKTDKGNEVKIDQNQDKNNPDQSLNNNPQFVPQTMQNTRTPQSQPSNSNSLEGLIQSRQQASSGRKLEF